MTVSRNSLPDGDDQDARLEKEPPTPKSITVSRRLQRAVAELVRIHGVEQAAKILGVSKESALRIVAGAGVRRGTIALTTEALANYHDRAEETGGHG